MFLNNLNDILELESARWFLWTPVCLGVGISIYFILPFEPGLYASCAFVISGAGFVVMGAKSIFRLLLSGLLFWIGVGFFLGQVRTNFVAAPLISGGSKVYQLQGWVESIHQSKSRSMRVLIHLQSLKKSNGETVAPERVPRKIRISIRHKNVRLLTGSFIKVSAVLRAPPAPTLPGGFDYGRHLWFKGIGGVGFAVTKPETVIADKNTSPPLSIQFVVYTGKLRKEISATILKHLQNRYGGLAVALITGDRSHIETNDLQALRNSGLAHILAISGLHMAIMAGTIYWVLRFILSAFPIIALRWPVKKISAIFALSGGVHYLIVSGAAVSTQRAFIMTAVMLMAIVLNRPVVTLRNVALAALIILLLKPESLLDAGFQMSFAAVTALIAIYEEVFSRRERRKREGQIVSPPTIFPIQYIKGIATTTIIAGLAVAPFAAYNFHQINQYSLLGNLLAMPVIGLIVMPMVLLFFLTAPFSIEYYPLKFMEWGLEVIVSISEYVSALPGAVRYVSQMPTYSLFFIISGGLWLAIWKLRWRYYGFFLIAAGLVLVAVKDFPDILIDEKGSIIALNRGDGLLIAPKQRAGQFSLKRWLQIYGDNRTVKQVQSKTLFKCDRKACVAKVKGHTVSFIKHPSAIDDDCTRAAIIVSPLRITRKCPSAKVMIDRTALGHSGAHAVYIRGNSIDIDTVNTYRYGRLWVKGKPY